MAILDALPEERCRELITSPYSTIASPNEFKTAMETVGRRDFYSDRPLSRLGMNRLAVPVVQADMVGSLYICAPTERKEQFLDQYVEALTRCRDEILKQI